MTNILELIPIEKFTKTELKNFEKIFKNNDENNQIYSLFLINQNDLKINLKTKNDNLSKRILKLKEIIIKNKKDNIISLKVINILENKILNLENKLTFYYEKINTNNNLIFGNLILILSSYVLIIIYYDKPKFRIY